MELYSIATSSAILDEVPRHRCCDQNRNKPEKRKNDEDDNHFQPPKKKSLMDLYKNSPKTSSTWSITSANNVKTTATSGSIFQTKKLELSRLNAVDDFIKIDDLSSQEQWNRKRKSKFSHIEKLNLQKINKPDKKTELNKILERLPTKKKNTGRALRMKNGLIDNPATYLAPQINFAISGIGKLLLHKDDYETLHGLTSISICVVEFVFGILVQRSG